MRKMLLLTFAFALFAGVGATTLVVEMNYSNGTLSCLSAEPQAGFPDDYRMFPNEGRFSYRLYAANGSMLDSFYFDAPTVHWDALDENGTMIGGEETVDGTFDISAKHFGNAARLVVKDGSKVACDISFASATPTATSTATPAATATPTSLPTARPAETNDGTALILAAVGLVLLAAFLLIGRKRR
ncbi:Uncharacterised protein [Candidatus Norongarragalina meridionalis]|nr:Uncharacterised protein [Candidatus Norongarragalina meridionalis]